MTETIKESINKIRDECDEIEEKIKPKRATTRGDPLVRLH